MNVKRMCILGELEKLRQKINKTDEKLVDLFIERRKVHISDCWAII